MSKESAAEVEDFANKVIEDFIEKYFKENPSFSTVHMKLDVCEAALSMCGVLVTGYMDVLGRYKIGLNEEQVVNLCGLLGFMDIFVANDVRLTTINGEDLVRLWKDGAIKWTTKINEMLIKTNES